MRVLAASWTLLIVVFLASCRHEAEIDKAPHLGRGKSVKVMVRQADVSQEVDGPNQIFACLIWAERLRVNLSEIEHEPPTGIKRIGDKVVPLTAEDLKPIGAAAELPILIVVRRNREGPFSWGLRNLFPPGEDGYTLKQKNELLLDDHVWATYEATAEPFTESLVIAGNEQRLGVDRVLLADFAIEPVHVEHLNVEGRELEEARDTLASDPVSHEEKRRRLQSVVTRLSDRDETLRKFLSIDPEVPPTQ